jgi:hypothetical protein
MPVFPGDLAGLCKVEQALKPEVQMHYAINIKNASISVGINRKKKATGLPLSPGRSAAFQLYRQPFFQELLSPTI